MGGGDTPSAPCFLGPPCGFFMRKGGREVAKRFAAEAIFIGGLCAEGRLTGEMPRALFGVLQAEKIFREMPRALFSVLRPEPLFLSISPCPLRVGRGMSCDTPLHPRTPEASPLDSIRCRHTLPILGETPGGGFAFPLIHDFPPPSAAPFTLSRCRGSSLPMLMGRSPYVTGGGVPLWPASWPGRNAEG